MDLAYMRTLSQDDAYAYAAQHAQVSPSVFRGMARTESANGTQMVSPKGAAGWFGIMPATQHTWEQRTGQKLDPHNFYDGLYLSALTLGENMEHYHGDVDKSLKAYNGSWREENWQNKETREYVGKVLGSDPTGARADNVARHNAPRPLTSSELHAWTTEDRANLAPADITKAKSPKAGDWRDLLKLPDSQQADGSLHPEMQDTIGRAAPEVMQQAWKSAQTFKDKATASLLENTVTAPIIHAMIREHPTEDPNWRAHYSEHWAELEKGLQSEHEVSWLRESTSKEDANRILGEIEDHRQNQKIINSGGQAQGLMLGLGAGLVDPVSWVATFGVGKGLEMAGLGSRAFLAGRAAREAEAAIDVPVFWKNKLEFNGATGEFEMAPAMRKNPLAGLADPGTGFVHPEWIQETRHWSAVPARAAIERNVGKGLASLAAEGAGVNVLSTAAIDASGEYVSPSDYAWAAGMGLGIAAIQAPFHLHGKPDLSLQHLSEAFQASSMEEQAAHAFRAQEELGPGATKEAITAKIQQYSKQAGIDRVRDALADVPDGHRFLPLEASEWMTKDPVVKKEVTDKHDLKSVSNEPERDVLAEVMAQASRIAAENPVNESALNTILRKITLGSEHGQGMESTGLTLLKSKSNTARATAMMLLEGTTGAGGRRRTAAISAVQRERIYMSQVHGIDVLARNWTRANGYHDFAEAINKRGLKEFSKRVYAHINERGSGNGIAEVDPNIRLAADKLEKGFDLMRTEQQHVGTVGAARLGPDSIGYIPRRMSSRTMVEINRNPNKAQAQAIRAEYADQLINRTGLKPKDADRVAAQIIEHATQKGYGSPDVPMSLHDPHGAQMVEDAIRALGYSPADTDKLLGKFSRGGAQHTKKRLDLDLNRPIPDADGKHTGKTLADLYDTDVMGLYRSYARRVSGEVALAQYGVMGKKGLNLLRQAMEKEGAHMDEVRAFDQIAAEFLNEPFGEHNHKAFDNMRMLSSAARLGGMGFTQFAEYGNAIASLGIHRTFAAIKDLPRLLHEVGDIKKLGKADNDLLNSVELLGGTIGGDDFQMSHKWDIKDENIQLYGTENLTVLDRVSRGMAHANSVLSFHRAILAVQTRGMAEQIIRKAVKFAAAGTDDVHLNDMGIGPEIRSAIRENLPHIAEFNESGRLTKLDLAKWQGDEGLRMDLVQAIERGAGQIIQRTYVGETGRWAHNGLLKLMLQFRTFGITAVEKQWGRTVHMSGGGFEGHMKAFGYTLGSMSIAVPVMLARAHLKTMGMSDSKRKKWVEQNMGVGHMARASVNLMSKTGVLGDAWDIGSGMYSGWGGDKNHDLADTIGSRGQGRKQLLGGTVGPALSLAEDGWQAVHGNTHSMQRLVPGSGLPYMQPLMNAITPD